MVKQDKNVLRRAMLLIEISIISFVSIVFMALSASGVLLRLELPPLLTYSGLFSIQNALWVVGSIGLFLSVIQLIMCSAVWCKKHHIENGIQYAWQHDKLLRNVRKALLNSGSAYGLDEYAGEHKISISPKIMLELERDLISGTLRIRNDIRYSKVLEKLDLSPALGRYIVTQSYFSDDRNWFIVEFEDSRIDNRLYFDNQDTLQAYSRQVGDNYLFFDKKHRVPLCSMLLCGLTGSGKSYALFSLIMQMKSWLRPATIYFLDPKMSGLYLLGNRLDSARTAGEIDEIIQKLEGVFLELNSRKSIFINESRNFDWGYKNLGLSPIVVVFEEFAAFAAVLKTLDKTTRDRVDSILRSIVLMGRQLGIYLLVVMQKSDATEIPTAIRENLPCKIALGNCGDTTYQTCFGYVDIPKQKLAPGEGFFTYAGKYNEPEPVSFPTLSKRFLDEVSRR